VTRKNREITSLLSKREVNNKGWGRERGLKRAETGKAASDSGDKER